MKTYKENKVDNQQDDKILDENRSKIEGVFKQLEADLKND